MKYRCKETNQKSLLKSFIRQILVRQYFYVICETVPFLSLESKGTKEEYPACFSSRDLSPLASEKQQTQPSPSDTLPLFSSFTWKTPKKQKGG